MRGLAFATLFLGALVSGGVARNLPRPAAIDLSNRAVSPLSDSAKVNVFVFVRTDCPVTNRYAPELKRLAKEYGGQGVKFWLIYPDHTESSADIEKHIATYGFPGTPLRDPKHSLEEYAQAKVAPEAAVFDAAGELKYHGRIDDRWVSFGVQRQVATRHDLELAIGEVLAGKPVAEPVTKAVGCYLADLR
ncbi:MAG TPA: redoxin domain-containing protein [Bryobacteraceae bacterium]|nr:redoxin domain-containing protein [Bryobacteraceae bacterium]